METKLEKEMRLFKAYAVVSTLLFVVFVFAAFTYSNRKQKFEEIDVERINVVEKNGMLKMVISNRERQPEPITAGKVSPRDGKSPGLIFYNDQGDECGGLIFSGQKKDNRYGAFSGLMLDQYQQDQILGLSYADDNGSRRAGLIVWDRPNIPMPEYNERLADAAKMPAGPEKEATMKTLRAPARMFVGRGRNGSPTVELYDSDEKPRVRIFLDGAGNPKLEFRDSSGKVIQTLPDSPGLKE
jgi:hypothetical protein